MITHHDQTQSLLDDPDFGRLKEHIIGATGLTYYLEKDADLAGRVLRRLQAKGRDCCREYLDDLMGHVDGDVELDRLIEELTVGETYFFRHTEVFRALRERVLPEIIERNRSTRRIRIWSAGCSIGAEPYSIAILLQDEFGTELADWDVSIVATDINRRFLAQAREGRFAEWAFRGVEPELRQRCFDREGRSWIIRSAYRRSVTFQYHNLVRHPIPSLPNNIVALDLILCRNVMIYFSRERVARLANEFHEALVPDGWLIVGSSELNTELFKAYQTRNLAGAVFYQRSPAATVTEVPTDHSEFSLEWEWRDTGLSDESWQPPSVCTAPILPEPPQGVPPPQLPATTNTFSLVAQAMKLADSGRLEEAIRLCHEAITQDALQAQAHLYLGMLQDQVGAYDFAEQSLRRAIYIDADCAVAHYHLGLLQQRQHRTPEAIRSFRNVLDTLEARGEGSVDKLALISAKDLADLALMHLEVLGR